MFSQMLQHRTDSKVLELLHIVLMGPMQEESMGGKKYVFMVIDDFSEFTWVRFIREKSDSFGTFKDICQDVQREQNRRIVKIRSYHDKEFESAKFSEFCAFRGISYKIFSSISSKHDDMFELKMRTVSESTRAMLHAKNLPYLFWAEAMNTACYVYNRVSLRVGTTTTLYELWKGMRPTVKYFHIFGSKCYVLADKEQNGKINHVSDEGIFLGYSSSSIAYRVFNSRTGVAMKSINVVIDDSITKQVIDVENDVGTSSWQIDETEREESCSVTTIASDHSQESSNLSDKEDTGQSKALIARYSSGRDIIGATKGRVNICLGFKLGPRISSSIQEKKILNCIIGTRDRVWINK